VGRHAPDDVARIDVLDAHFRADLLKVVLDRLAQKSSDVSVLEVARGSQPDSLQRLNQPEGKGKQCLRRFSLRRREVTDYLGREVPSPWRSSADASSLSSVPPEDRSMVDCSRCCQYLKA
jgi:hypothetical protein